MTRFCPHVGTKSSTAHFGKLKEVLLGIWNPLSGKAHQGKQVSVPEVGFAY